MAAGLGFKTFNTGDVLSAADVNGYLMQGVLVFADATARDAAITSPQEGQFAYTKDNNSLWYYTGSAWAASGATGDIEGVTAGVGISGGGTSGTVTITNSMATAIDAKGDLIVGTGADTFSRLAVGATNGHILTVDSAEATGMKWAAAAGGGSGLTRLTTLNPSAVSETIADSVFSSTYDNYLIVGYVNTSANANVTMQLRSGGSNLTTNTYITGWAGSTTNYTQWFLSDNVAADRNFAFSITLTRPFLAAVKQGVFQCSRQGVAPYSSDIYEPTATSRDGFRIFVGAGTITGQVVVYGLAE
jgi:hypothetical protein